jgi:hypothetical protein
MDGDWLPRPGRSRQTLHNDWNCYVLYRLPYGVEYGVYYRDNSEMPEGVISALRARTARLLLSAAGS